MIAETLKRQRDRLGLSAKRVAELSRLSPGRLQGLESGALEPTLNELCALGTALAFDPAAVLRGHDLADPRRSAARFRAPSGVQQLGGEDARTLARAAELGRIGAWLMGEVADQQPRLPALREVKGLDPCREPWREGYDLGEHARRRLAPEAAPIVSVQGLLEAFHVHVAHVSLSDRRHVAVSIYEPGAMPVVLLNPRASRVQNALARRAVMAHEICHLLHDGGDGDLLTLVTHQANQESFEKRANGFAPGFLAPRDWTRSRTKAAHLAPRAVVREIATIWGFTFEGAVWHAKNAELIRTDEADALVNDDEVTDLGAFEPPVARVALPEELAVAPSAMSDGLIRDWIVRALEDGAISMGRARELLLFA